MKQVSSSEQRVKEGFIGQKMLVIPKNIRRSIKNNPLISSLYFTDIGVYPHATNHFRERNPGCKQYILIYCVEGEGWVQIGSKKYIISPNTFFIIPKNTTHSYGATENNFWSIYWLHFSGVQADELYERYKENYASQVAKVLLEESRLNLFTKIISLLESGYSMKNVEYTNICLWQLLASFLYSQYHKESSYEVTSDRIECSIQYMKEHLDKPLSVEDIASHFHYSVSHYFTVFKKKTGYSPLHYFNQMKIQKGCEYLSFTSMSVKEIGFKLGYQDPLYFSRIFKKLMGLSPIQYRNTYVYGN